MLGATCSLQWRGLKCQSMEIIGSSRLGEVGHSVCALRYPLSGLCPLCAKCFLNKFYKTSENDVENEDVRQHNLLPVFFPETQTGPEPTGRLCENTKVKHV